MNVLRFTAVAAVALPLALACRAKGPETPSIQTAEVTRQDIIVDVEATGVVEPINVVEVKSKASGQITRMPVETGSLVKPGDLLVQLDARDVRNQYNQSLAEVRAAEASLEVSRAQKKRSDELLSQRVVTAQENETASLAYANAQAQLVRARTSLDLAQQRLEDATIRAPIAGTVIDKTVSLGQVITSATGSASGGTTLLKMADLNQVRVRALVTETDIGGVQPGQQATVTVDAYPDRPFRGVVEKIEPQAVVTQSVTQFPVLVTIQNREGLLKPGMNGEVSIMLSRRDNVLAVPNDAVRTPREAAQAAAALGLDAEAVQAQIRAQMAQANGGPGSGSPGARNAVSRGDVALAEPAAQQTGRQAGAGGPGGGQREGRRRRQRGDSAGAVRAGGGLQMRDPASAEMASGTPSNGSTSRPGLVFVGDSGRFTPRVVRLGVGNYDYTEVLSGVKEGEKVALLSAATLQMQRAQMNDRIRSMQGGAIPGGARAGGARGARPR